MWNQTCIIQQSDLVCKIICKLVKIFPHTTLMYSKGWFLTHENIKLLQSKYRINFKHIIAYKLLKFMHLCMCLSIIIYRHEFIRKVSYSKCALQLVEWKFSSSNWKIGNKKYIFSSINSLAVSWRVIRIFLVYITESVSIEILLRSVEKRNFSWIYFYLLGNIQKFLYILCAIKMCIKSLLSSK